MRIDLGQLNHYISPSLSAFVQFRSLFSVNLLPPSYSKLCQPSLIYTDDIAPSFLCSLLGDRQPTTPSLHPLCLSYSTQPSNHSSPVVSFGVLLAENSPLLPLTAWLGNAYFTIKHLGHKNFLLLPSLLCSTTKITGTLSSHQRRRLENRQVATSLLADLVCLACSCDTTRVCLPN